MADQKISELTALTGANVADDDAIAIVDTSATETKKIVFSELKNALDTATGFVRITGDTMTGDLNFGDNDKAIFGAGSDLQIYHDGSNSIIEDVGTGDLRIRGGNDIHIRTPADENYIVCNQDSSVDLYYDAVKKLTTTSTGVDVTGTVTADGLTVDAQTSYFRSTGATAIQLEDTDGGFTATKLNTENGGRDVRLSGAQDIIFSNDTGTLARFDNGGDISFYEDTGSTPKLHWSASDERLGIGTSSPSAPLTVKAPSNAEAIHVIGRSDDIGQIIFVEADGTTKNARIDARNTHLNIGTLTSLPLKFETNATERMRIDSSGGLTIKAAASSATTAVFGGTNVVNGITAVPSSAGTPFTVGRDTGSGRSAHFGGHLKFDSGYGIDFSATGDGSGTDTSELLDDYEEGTWTPTADAGITGFSIQSATYTKVGRMVTLMIYVTSPTGNSGSNLQIGGLPYTPATNNYSGGWIECNTNGHMAMARTNSTNTFLSFFYPDPSTAHRVSLTGNDVGSSHILGSITYQTG